MQGLSQSLPGRGSLISPVPTLRGGLLSLSLSLSGLPAAASDMAGGWGLENTEDRALDPPRAGSFREVGVGPSLMGIVSPDSRVGHRGYASKSQGCIHK